VAVSLHFYTLFDSRYTTRGLTMLDSLARTCRQPFDVTILAMDDTAAAVLGRLQQPNWRIVRVPDLQDQVFIDLEQTRPRREFCWTAAPVLSTWMIETAADDALVVYVDADVMFFDDPLILLNELADGGTVLIHEHRYSPDRTQYEATSGRFNVGFVAFRVGEEARRCARRWREQVIEKCELDPDNGYCGDQGYLNEWPALYPGLRIMKNIGGGVAPWNLLAYRGEGLLSQPKVDDNKVVFFHYHSFRTVAVRRLGLIGARPAYGYEFSRRFNLIFFARYANRIRRYSRQAKRGGLPQMIDETVDWRTFFKGLITGQYVLALPL